MTHVSNEPAIWFKNQRVWRTGFQAVVGLVPVVATVLGILHAQWPAAWLGAAAATALAVQTALAKLMANDVVNAWLIRWTPFGSEPRAGVASLTARNE